MSAPTYRVAVIGGDGIGPEVTAAAQRVVDAAAGADFRVEWLPVVAGGAAIDAVTARRCATRTSPFAPVLTQCSLVRWAGRAGTTPLPACVLSRPCSGCVAAWGCSPTCAR